MARVVCGILTLFLIMGLLQGTGSAWWTGTRAMVAGEYFEHHIREPAVRLEVRLSAMTLTVGGMVRVSLENRSDRSIIAFMELVPSIGTSVFERTVIWTPPVNADGWVLRFEVVQGTATVGAGQMMYRREQPFGTWGGWVTATALSVVEFMTPAGQWQTAVRLPYPSVYPRLVLGARQDITLRWQGHTEGVVIFAAGTEVFRGNPAMSGIWRTVTLNQALIPWRGTFAITVFDVGNMGAEPWDVFVEYTSVVPTGHIASPASGFSQTSRVVNLQGGVNSIPAGAIVGVEISRVGEQPLFQPITPVSGAWALTVDHAASGVFTYRLQMRVGDAITNLHVITGTIVETGAAPTLPPGAGVIETLGWMTEILIYWLSMPFVFVASLLRTVVNNVAQMTEGTAAIASMFSVFWVAMPPEIMTIFMAAIPIMIILWVFKR